MFGHFKQGSGTLFGNVNDSAKNSTSLFGNTTSNLFGSPKKEDSPFKGTPQYDDNEEEGADEAHQAL